MTQPALANDVVLTLTVPGGGPTYDFSPLYPKWSRSLSPERDDPQGPVFFRVDMNLTGKILSMSGSHEEIINRFLAIQSFAEHGTLILYHKAGDTVLADNVTVYTNGIDKPENWDTWDGDYSLRLYYFEAGTEHAFSATYVHTGGTYTFERVPTWSHGIKVNRSSYNADLTGSSATITLAGRLYAGNNADLITKIDALNSAFRRDGVLNYGAASYTVRAVSVECGAAVPNNYAPYSISLAYDIGTMIELSVRTTFSRLHRNPIIKSKPLCDEISVQQRGVSGQEISWSVKVKAKSIGNARSLLATELANRVYPGGVEMPGGTEVWDENEVSVECSLTKFYKDPVLSNLSGT